MWYCIKYWGNWFYLLVRFFRLVSYEGFTITPANLKVEGHTAAYGGGTLEVGRLDVWLEVRQKSESTLTLSHFNLPDFRLTLSLDTD